MKATPSITSIAGLQVGHAQDEVALTGVTVVLCEQGAVGGVDQRGGAPGTRETDALRPMHLVEQVHGVVLSGGSAFGLDSASGVVRYLESRHVGFDARVARIPIVPAAILFDLGIGRADVRPGPEMGYQACLNASREPPAEGNVGAGTGCSVGKVLGIERAVKSGIGSSAIDLGKGLLVAALVAVNAFGDVIDPATGIVIAGARNLSTAIGVRRPGGLFANTLEVMRSKPRRKKLRFASHDNTVIGVVATNAQLNKEQASKVAQMAQDGVARAIRPAHTMLDGDTLFCIATGERQADVNLVGAYAAEAVTLAILRAVKSARSAGGLPAIHDIRGEG